MLRDGVVHRRSRAVLSVFGPERPECGGEPLRVVEVIEHGDDGPTQHRCLGPDIRAEHRAYGGMAFEQELIEPRRQALFVVDEPQAGFK
jgi:hypothetical protein